MGWGTKQTSFQRRYPMTKRYMKRYSTSLITVTAKSLQSCLTLCNPREGSPPGFTVPGILQARILEWVAISFSNAWKRKVKGKSLSRVRLFATPWAAAHQAPPSMGFSRREYGVGCHRLLHFIPGKPLKTILSPKAYLNIRNKSD